MPITVAPPACWFYLRRSVVADVDVSRLPVPLSELGVATPDELRRPPDELRVESARRLKLVLVDEVVGEVLARVEPELHCRRPVGGRAVVGPVDEAVDVLSDRKPC